MGTRRLTLAGLCGGAALLASLVVANAASACMPAMALPGETQEAMVARLQAEQTKYEQERQRNLWSEADRVFVARTFDQYALDLEAWERQFQATMAGGTKPSRSSAKRPVPLIPPPPAPPYVGEREAVITLKAVTSLKGVAPERPFEIVETLSSTSCGPFFRFDAGNGAGDDEVLVVFMKGPYPTREGVLEAMDPARVIEPKIKAALDKAGAAR